MHSVQPFTLGIILFYTVNLCLFLLPGFAVMLGIGARRRLGANQAIIVVVTASAAVGYVAFWVYFGSKPAGEIFSYAVVLASAWTLARKLRRMPNLKTLTKSIMRPFAYVLFAGLFYSCLFFVFQNPFTTGTGLGDVRFFKVVRPDDNQIPFIFAERIYEQKPLKPFCCGNWLSSDRPPLQTGIFLFRRPLRFFPNVALHYQLLATALQCLWLCGVWTFLTALRVPEKRIKQAIGFLIFSGFLFYNSVYVWPKLLAATFILFSFSIVFEALTGNRSLTLFDTTLGALCISLAIMAHPGSVFSLPALLLILLVKRKVPTVRQCAWAAIMFGLIAAPWSAYQKYYDPPGTRLLKMHLAGIYNPDSQSVWQAIKGAYRERSLATIVHYKLANLSTLLGPKMIDGYGFTGIEAHHGLRLNSEVTEATRIAQREYIWNAVGILNIGWLVGLALLLKKRRPTIIPYSGLIVAAAIVNLFVWSIVLLGPGQTFTTHSSYADILLLSIGLLGFIFVLPPIGTAILFAVQLFNFCVIWVWSPKPPGPLEVIGVGAPVLQIPLLICAILGALGLIWHFGKSYIGLGSLRPAADRISGNRLRSAPARRP
jgi:hypothetical protein